ncbi:hypothetical protein ABIA33_002266 [Streptacidiphilus sp. MAP12-16]|uniref:GAP family protein n=1 Tax=Streptacidiphilus sp. MAP12-16 TaxID=3156300 RepID=UPI0035193826
MIFDLVLLGLAITLEPVPITAFILLVSGDRGVRKGLAFILAWLAGLVAVLAGVLSLTGGKPPHQHTSPSTTALAVKLAVGVGLLLYGNHRRHRAGRPHKTPAWLARVDRASSWTAAGLAVLVQPWALVAAGGATVVDAKISSIESYLMLVFFCLLSSASLLAIELYATFAPSAAQARLARLRTWMDDHQDQAVVALSLLVGFWLVGKSIYQLVQ